MTRRTRTGIIIIPRPYIPNWNILINDVNRNFNFLDIEINRLATEGTGNFRMVMFNDNNKLAFSGMEKLEVQADFGGGTTTFFIGTIEEIKNNLRDSPEFRLNGRHISGELADLKVTEKFTNAEISTIFSSIVSSYASVPTVKTSYTTTNVRTTGITTSISFEHTPFYDALKELAYRANFDFYVDNNRDFHFFQSGTMTNNADPIHKYNVINIEGLGDSVVEIKNRIIAYGSTSSGLPIIYETNDTSSQSLYGIREKFISDSRISSLDIAKGITNAFLSYMKDKKSIGTVASLGLPSLNPGDTIWIIDHTAGLRNQYRIIEITDRISNISEVPWITTVTVERIGSVRFSGLLKSIFLNASSQSVDFKNENKMRYSKVDEFDNQSQVESSVNASISDSVFSQAALGTDGRITSTTTEASLDVTQVELRASGQNLNSSAFEVSTDGGVSYTAVTLNALTNVASGKLLKVRITLTDNSTNPLPRCEGYSLLYK